MAARTKPSKEPALIPGYEGAVLTEAQVRITASRYGKRVMRCRPGTFEWRYGRKTADSSLYEAGVRFATLWEIAGIADASSPDLMKEVSGRWNGIPDRRIEAMQKVAALRPQIGKWGMARLVDYCVMGTTIEEIASKWDSDERGMRTVLEQDLRAVAEHFRYV